METKKRRRKVDHFPARLGWLQINEIRSNIESLFVGPHFPGLPPTVYPYDPGVRAEIRFKNSFGASIIRSHFTHGGDQGLYELGIFIYHGDGQGCLATTPLNPDGDVFGYLSPKEVADLLIKITQLCQDQGTAFEPIALKEAGAAFTNAGDGTDSGEKFDQK